MAGFVKLDCGILNSTLWGDTEARDVFITALLMAYPHEVTEPMVQVHVRTLEETGFVVQPGFYGFVPAAGVGIVRRSGVEQEAGLAALERLGAPEAESRTPDYEGRRLVRVTGGYIILNYMLYRNRDYTSAERSKRWRDRQRSSSAVTPRNASERVDTRDVTQAEVQKTEVQSTRVQNPRARAAARPDPDSSSADGADAADASSKSRTVPDTAGRKRPTEAELPDDVDPEVWTDWLAYRRSKRAPFSAAALKATRREADKDGLTLQEAILVTMSAGWQGFVAGRRSSNNGAAGRSHDQGHLAIPKNPPPGYYKN